MQANITTKKAAFKVDKGYADFLERPNAGHFYPQCF